MLCDGCKWKKFNLMSWLFSRKDHRRLYDRCVHPKVLEVQNIQQGFRYVALMWPCRDGMLKELK